MVVLRKEPPSPALTQELRAALADSSNFVVAEAAKAVTEANGDTLSSDLLAAFPRFLIDPVKTDKLCVAKIAILDALNRIEFMDPTIFRQHVRYIQMEPVWGKSEDRAADLRGACAFGLVRTDTMRSLPILADLLADPEKGTRVAAAMALSGATQTAAVPLLRLKARLGDKDPEVISACFASLLSFDWQDALPFIAEFLTHSSPDVCAMAILALGESRRPEALEYLTRQWKRRGLVDVEAELLLGISMLRLPAATAFLLDLIGDSSDAAALAVEALAVQGHNAQVREQTEAAVDRTGDARLRRLFDAKFDRK
jgi:HEAT repeat protein